LKLILFTANIFKALSQLIILLMRALKLLLTFFQVVFEIFHLSQFLRMGAGQCRGTLEFVEHMAFCDGAKRCVAHGRVINAVVRI